MRFIIALCFSCVAMLPASLAAQTADAQKAEQAVQSIITRAIDILRNEPTLDARKASFHSLLDEYANMRRIAKFSLGQYGRSISEEDFATFQTLFQNMMVNVYTNRLTEYSDEDIIISHSQLKKKNAIVFSKITFPNGRDPIDIDWWMLLEKDGSYKLFDIRVLGIWLAQEQRASFASILSKNRGDIQSLFTHIRTMTGTSEN